MKKILICCACLDLVVSSSAQNKIAFSTQNYAGFFEGDHAAAPQLQTINGIKYGTWFAGIGAGLDWYYLRSIPLFASINKSFFEKTNHRFFVSADIGVNYPWIRTIQNPWLETTNDEYHNGKYFASGIGYKIPVGKKSDVVILHVGYSYKDLSERTRRVYPCLVGPCPEYIDTYNFNLRRLSFRMGWSF